MGRPLFSLLSLATAGLMAWPSAPLMAASGAEGQTTTNRSATLLARGGGGGGARGDGASADGG